MFGSPTSKPDWPAVAVDRLRPGVRAAVVEPGAVVLRAAHQLPGRVLRVERHALELHRGQALVEAVDARRHRREQSSARQDARGAERTVGALRRDIGVEAARADDATVRAAPPDVRVPRLEDELVLVGMDRVERRVHRHVRERPVAVCRVGLTRGGRAQHRPRIGAAAELAVRVRADHEHRVGRPVRGHHVLVVPALAGAEVERRVERVAVDVRRQLLPQRRVRRALCEQTRVVGAEERRVRVEDRRRAGRELHRALGAVGRVDPHLPVLDRQIEHRAVGVQHRERCGRCLGAKTCWNGPPPTDR